MRPAHTINPQLLRALVAAFAASLAITACGSTDEESSGLTVTATTGILQDITENVAGNQVTVEQLIPDGSSPHDFQLSAKDRAGAEDAALLVENGAGLEAGIHTGEIDVPRFTLADNVGKLRAEDPHVWMDPARVAAAMPALGEALADADPANAKGYRARANAYALELRELDAEIEEALARIPKANRELVTSHDSLGYFADRYDFEVVATPFPASGPEAEPSAATIDEVERAIEETDVPAVFAQEDDDPEVLKMIAAETGVGIEDGLRIEAPGTAGGYLEMMREDAGMILDRLG